MYAAKKSNPSVAAAAIRKWPSDWHRLNTGQHARLIHMLNLWAGDRPVVQGIHAGHRSWAQVAAPKIGDQTGIRTGIQEGQLGPFMKGMYDVLKDGKVSIAAMMDGSTTMLANIAQVPTMVSALAQQTEVGNITAMTGLKWALDNYDIDAATAASWYHQGLYSAVEAWLSLPQASSSKLAVAVWSK